MDRRRCVKRMASAVNLHTEPLPCMPFIEIAGDRRVLIERHLGVLEYDKNKISVKVKTGHISIAGNNLELTQMSRYSLVIYGEIVSVSIHAERRERCLER